MVDTEVAFGAEGPVRPWIFEASKHKQEYFCKKVTVTDLRTASCTIDYSPDDFDDEVWDIASTALHRLGLALPLPYLPAGPVPDA